MNYEEMLSRGKKDLPEVVTEVTRFQIPKVQGHLQGNKTIISNFRAIASVLNRPSKHLLKYILKELATPGETEGQFAVIGRKVPASFINKKIEEYVEMYILCKECGKPDTKLKSEGKFIFMQCQACGARASVPSLK